jgi:UDP-2,3-diacylglucosamine pyrophosphatase LpxH
VNEETTPPPTVWIVSDLHLDANPDTAAMARSDAFARFLSQLAAYQLDHEATPNQLVILGDFMDLPNTTIDEARTAIEGIAIAHGKVLTALNVVLSTGLDLIVVPGNHDIELTIEDVFSVLSRCLNVNTDGNGSVKLSPWIYYIPGLMYAEHGNQHHDINWFSNVLTPTYMDDHERIQRTAARWWSHLRSPDDNDPSGPRSQLTGLAALTNSLRRRPSWAMPYDRYIATVAVPYGASIEIGAEAVRALDATTRRGSLSIFLRLARKPVQRFWARFRHSGDPSASVGRERYLRDAVPDVVAITRSHGIGVPFYVFGHTHVASSSPVDGEAVYLNAGTWSGQLPTDRASQPELWFTFLKITDTSADLMRWDDSLQDWFVLDVQESELPG